MACLITCALLVSLTASDSPSQEQALKLPTWVPVLVGVACPVLFAVQGMFMKHLAAESVGFDCRTLTFATSGLLNSICLLFALTVYWRRIEKFDSYLFGVGLVGSIIDISSYASVFTALALGPAGPVAALSSVSSILLTII